MGMTFEKSTGRYLTALQHGATVDAALAEATMSQHRDAVFEAAVAMLESEGAIDMKRLASLAGISRASLYRYYPDKLAVEAEVAAAVAQRMTEAAKPFDDIVQRLDAAMGALMAFPGGAAALAPVAAVADVNVIAESVETIIGHVAATPVILGFAALVATASRRGQLDDVEVMRQAITKQFALSYG